MLHGPIVKLAIWCVTLLGLAPAMVLALAVALFAVVGAFEKPENPEGQIVLRHNSWIQVGPIRLDDWHPRVWAGAALVVGVVLIVTAMVFLLHVPTKA